MYDKVSILKQVNVTASNASSPIGEAPNLKGVSVGALIAASRARSNNAAVAQLVDWTSKFPPSKRRSLYRRATAPFRRQWHRLKATYNYWKNY